MRLTLSQQDVYYEQLLYPNEPIYNIGAKISIEGPLQYKALNVAYVALINQHDSARIVFREKGGQHQMRILDVHKSKLALIDFSQHEDPLAAAEAYMLQEFAKAFDLSTGELLHTFTLLKVREDFHYLYTCFHHLIIDGWGTSVMFQRLVANYNEILERGAIQSSYPYSYKDFMTEDASYEGSEEYELDKSYWVNRFETLPTPLVQSRSHSSGVQRSKRASLTISRAVYDQLGVLAKTCKASTFQVLLASLFLYFGRKYSNANFAIGLPVLNRSKRLYKQTVGLFMGVSPLHIPLDFEASFADLVSKIKHQLRQDYRHQRFPLGKLIQELQVFQQQGRLFDIMLSYQKQDFSQHFTDTYTRVLPLTHHAELNGMAIFIREFDPSEDVTIDFDYNLNYFDPVEMQTAMIHLEQLLHDILRHPDRPLRAFQYLPKEEREQLLHGFNQSGVDYPRQSTFLAEFERQVTLQASKIAVADAQQQLSYVALQSQSNQIAHYLDEQFGTEDQSPVAVLMERSADLIVVLMGILKSGRAYIPLDPAFPQERLAYILQHSQSKILIQDNAYELAEDASIHKIQLEELKEAIKELPVGHQSRATWSNTAYIIYTSGSTGRPKGVEIGHRALLNFLWSMREQPGIVPTDHWFSVTTASFDISILEFFGPLMAGATLYIADRELLGQPKELMSSMATVKPTIVQATPSFYQLLYHAGWKGQKGTKILCGGDLLSQSLAKKLLRDHEELWNMYGPTEATIWCSCKRLRHHSEASNIGKPIQNTQLYLLDPWGHPCPIGEQGQLFIGGEGLAKGYFRAPELTASKFRNNPYAEGRLYESGDLGKWTKDGEIEFLGRNDHQVKVRGYRVELEEIENQLHQIEGIVDAVVVAKKGEAQESFLVAYYLSDRELDKAQLLAALEKNLPGYMIPPSLLPVEAFPLTPNKKVDRKKLAAMALQNFVSSDAFVPPQSLLEVQLSELWQSVLQINGPISIKDAFFSLGGHSLNAMRLIALIQERLGFVISLKTLFAHPDIESLASHLQQIVPQKPLAIDWVEERPYYPLTPAQQQLWLACQQGDQLIAYNMAAAYDLVGIPRLERMEAAIRRLIQQQDILRSNFVEIVGEAQQLVRPMKEIDFVIERDKRQPEEIEAVIEEFANRPFALEKDLLLRMKLLQYGEQRFCLLFCTHHLLMDGWSLERFVQDFIHVYQNRLAPETVEYVSRSLQFRDYAVHLHAQKAAKDQTASTGFWRKYLAAYATPYNLPVDHRVDTASAKGREIRFEIGAALLESLKQQASQYKVTLYALLAAAMKVVIHHRSARMDICIACVHAGRNHPDLLPLYGSFAKTLPLRSQLMPEMSFVQLMQQVQEHLLSIDQHQDALPEGATVPVPDLLFVLQNLDHSLDAIVAMEDFSLHERLLEPHYSRLPVVINLIPKGDALEGRVSYQTDLYKTESIQLTIWMLEQVLATLAERPLASIVESKPTAAVESPADTQFEFNF